MTFPQKLFFLIAVALLHPTFPHHVVFEEIGKMAGALFYVHAIVPVNISGLAHAVNNFKEDIRTLLALYHKNRQPMGLANNEFYHQRILDLFTLASSDADAMLTSIHGLRDTLRAAAAETHLPHDDHEYRIRRRSPFSIIGGVIGTLMGWFTQRRLNNLRERMEEVEDQQHRLLQVQAVKLRQL